MSKHTPETYLSDLFESFLRERKYELGVSTATISWYRQAWGLFVGKKTLSLPDLTEDRLKEFAYGQRDRGIKPISVYTRARALNSFMRWLHAHKHLDELIGYVPDKGGKRVIQTLKVDSLKTLVTFRPKTWNHKRIHTLTVALLDTGCRISELLDSNVSDWDLDDLLVTVIGKGDKQRRIPFSSELRKVIHRWSETRGETDLMFPSRTGGKWQRRNAQRSFHLLQEHLNLSAVGFHLLRHTFATEYLRRGGDVVRLQRTLGHEDLSTTTKYLHMLTDDLSAAHGKVGMLRKF